MRAVLLTILYFSITNLKVLKLKVFPRSTKSKFDLKSDKIWKLGTSAF